jgi:hypothetical protein
MNKLHAVWAFSAIANSRPFLCAGLQGQLYEEHGKSGPDVIGLARELRVRITKSRLETAPVIFNLDRYLRWLRAKVSKERTAVSTNRFGHLERAI